CGLKTDGSVACGGLNHYGQATPPAGPFTQVSAGREHTCGLKTDGTVACWGNNTQGQATPPAGTFTQVSAGGAAGGGYGWEFFGGVGHTCGVKADGTVACWGYNEFGQATPPASTFTQVSAGGYDACGLQSDHSVTCWGRYAIAQTPNRPPAVGSIATHAGSGPLGRTVTATAAFSDPDITDTHTALMDWGDGASSAAAVTETSGSGSATATHSYATPGVYTLTVSVTDSRGGAGVGTLRFLFLPGTTVPIDQTASRSRVLP